MICWKQCARPSSLKEREREALWWCDEPGTRKESSPPTGLGLLMSKCSALLPIRTSFPLRANCDGWIGFHFQPQANRHGHDSLGFSVNRNNLASHTSRDRWTVVVDLSQFQILLAHLAHLSACVGWPSVLWMTCAFYPLTWGSCRWWVGPEPPLYGQEWKPSVAAECSEMHPFSMHWWKTLNGWVLGSGFRVLLSLMLNKGT